jgi:hypothetical protein
MEAMKVIVSKREKIDQEMQQKILQLQDKYQELCKLNIVLAKTAE